ncbi:MAG: signal recognition particle-docking protein FtsY [Candidatus Diapherotrites archaeon]|nr:signal recognition particle-docking protein FtsY [Candidatus Diapherotrites archaeon]
MFDFLKKKIEKFTRQVSHKPPAAPEPLEKTFEEPEKPFQETKPTPDEREVEAPEPKTGTEPVAPETKTQLAVPEEKLIQQDTQETSEKPAEAKETPAEKTGVSRGKTFGLNTISKIKQSVFGSIKVKKEDFKDALFELELGLIESDVSMDCARQINHDIGEHLEGLEIKRGENISRRIRQEIKKVLLETMQGSEFDLIGEIKSASAGKKPVVVLFVGPNGAGKTTTIAKIAKMLKDNSTNSILCAADTFRAAAIQQLETHAKNLDIKLIKHDYGADPAAVVFDAVRSAESKKIDAVLIDTAGRQDTSHNLMQELDKIVKVSKPDFTVFVGESISGHGIINQINTFKRISNVNAVILTKLDTDVKGGTALSIFHSSHVPIAFFGTGQELFDLKKFKSGEFAENLVEE